MAPLAASTGCTPADLGPGVTEPTFAEQLRAVRARGSEGIHVTASPVFDSDLDGIADATALRVLLVDHQGSRITVAGIRQLVGLPALEHLRIRGSGIDDEALAQIANLQSLEILNLPQGTFTDAGLTELKRLPNLVQFRFSSPHVTDAGMQTLAELPALARLHLIGVPLTDAGLAVLARIEGLESLYVDDIDFSQAAWDELFRVRESLGRPLHVHINQEHHDRDPHQHKHSP